MKEAVTKVIDTLTQEDFHGALQKLLERYNKCIAAGGDYFEGIKVSCMYSTPLTFCNPQICSSTKINTSLIFIM